MEKLFTIILFFTSFVLFIILFAEHNKNKKNMDEVLRAIELKVDSNIEAAKPEEIRYSNKLSYKIYTKYYRSKFQQANLNLKYEEFRNLFAIISIIYIVGAIALLIVFSPIASIATIALLTFLLYKLPDILVTSKKNARARALAAQKEDVLTLLVSCSSTTMSTENAFETISRELKPPASEIFKNAADMCKLGMKPKEVLRYLRDTFNSNDFSFLLASYEMWLESSGNLKDTYDLVQREIRDRNEIDMEMQSNSKNAYVFFVILIGMALMLIGTSFAMLTDIMMQYVGGTVGQVLVISSFGVLFICIHLINKLKYSIKY